MNITRQKEGAKNKEIFTSHVSFEGEEQLGLTSLQAVLLNGVEEFRTRCK